MTKTSPTTARTKANNHLPARLGVRLIVRLVGVRILAPLLLDPPIVETVVTELLLPTPTSSMFRAVWLVIPTPEIVTSTASFEWPTTTRLPLLAMPPTVMRVFAPLATPRAPIFPLFSPAPWHLLKLECPLQLRLSIIRRSRVVVLLVTGLHVTTLTILLLLLTPTFSIFEVASLRVSVLALLKW